ncbi:transporter, UIT1 family [Oscillibacter sp. PC13]|uniref:SLC13 family permease n=1 Tax=Oscillibacter sp. PC13 TaxID=1855299 RepID=UPI0008E7BF03|nr:SLC13 family permease [Oscillibacter sp. PC13]SFO98554.1 transporter, UIT1 family [Oscillibacter sp. PC13]
MDYALLSLILIASVFLVGTCMKDSSAVGMLSLAAAFLLGKLSGMDDAAIISHFPAAMFLRICGIMFFFAIFQANGAIELLAKKLLSKIGRSARLMPIFLFYMGVILSSLGINSLAGMAILSGLGISLAEASGNKPLLFGFAGGYGIACGCYSPINEFTANITSACESAGLSVNLFSIYILCLIGYSLSFGAVYLALGGWRLKGTLENKVLEELPAFTRSQSISLAGLAVVIILVVFFQMDVGWSGLIVGMACILLGACRCEAVLKKVALSSLMLVSGVGTLVNLVSGLGGFTLLSTAMAAVMNRVTVAPILSLAASVIGMFTLARVVVMTLIPTIPGILAAIPSASADLAVVATAGGAFASVFGPLTAFGILLLSSLSQQYGDEEAQKQFMPLLYLSFGCSLMLALFFAVLSFFDVLW